jgi:hypothetical protein
MATQALNGSGNVSYTNQTGKNVRLLINYMAVNASSQNVTFSWGNGGQYVVSGLNFAFGKSLAYSKIETTTINNNYQPPNGAPQSWSLSQYQSTASKNLIGATSDQKPPTKPLGVPIEYILSPNQSFSVSGSSNSIGAYNILTITEN